MKAKIKIPNSLSEITLEQYQKYLNIEDPTDQAIIATLCDIPYNVIRQITRTSVTEIAESLKELLNQEVSLVPTFQMGSMTYGFIPNLDEITFGEYIDCTTYLKEDWEDVHKLMAVLYRPVTNTYKDKYQIEEYKVSLEREQLMKTMPLNVALGAMVFFCHLAADLLSVTQKYLQEEVEAHLLKNGDGILRSTDWQMKTSKNLTISPN